MHSKFKTVSTWIINSFKNAELEQPWFMQSNFFLSAHVCSMPVPTSVFWVPESGVAEHIKFPFEEQSDTHQSWAFWLFVPLVLRVSSCEESFCSVSQREDAGQFRMIKVQRWTSSLSVLWKASVCWLSLSSSAARGCQRVKRSVCNCRLPLFPANTSSDSQKRSPNHCPLPVWQLERETFL